MKSILSAFLGTALLVTFAAPTVGVASQVATSTAASTANVLSYDAAYNLFLNTDGSVASGCNGDSDCPLSARCDERYSICINSDGSGSSGCNGDTDCPGSTLCDQASGTCKIQK